MTAPNTLAALWVASPVSHSLLDEALRRHAPAALAQARRPNVNLSPLALRTGLLAALPQALDVGWLECVTHRWWPQAQRATHWVPPIRFSLWPSLDAGHNADSVDRFSIGLRIAIELTPVGDQQASNLEGTLALLRQARPWLATMQLWVADGRPNDDALCFHTARQQVLLPAVTL